MDGAKPLSEPMMVSLLTHICVTRPQWVSILTLEKNRYLADDVLTRIFVDEKFSILIEFCLKFVPTCAYDNQLALVHVNGLSPNRWQVVTWTSSLIHICVSRAQRVNTLRPRPNGCYFADDIFKCFSLIENLWFFYYNFTEICFLGSDWQYGSIGSDNGLASNTHQAIILTNDGLGYWHIYASLGLNELILTRKYYFIAFTWHLEKWCPVWTKDVFCNHTYIPEKSSPLRYYYNVWCIFIRKYLPVHNSENGHKFTLTILNPERPHAALSRNSLSHIDSMNQW